MTLTWHRRLFWARVAAEAWLRSLLPRRLVWRRWYDDERNLARLAAKHAWRAAWRGLSR